MEIKKIKRKILVKTYLITFEYQTHKGYRREQQRQIKGFDKEEVKTYFKGWAKKQRTMANATILAIDELKEDIEVIEI